MYELWIKINNDEYILADLGEDIPAMTYQSNDIAELQNRQANYSLSFKLPKTKRNCEILGFSDIPDIDTDFPYKKHDCRLYINNYNIAGEESYLILDKIQDASFECQILSGIANFFDQLKAKKLSDIDLGTIEWNPNAVKMTDSIYDKYVYGIAEFSQKGEILTIDNKHNLITKYALPFAKLNGVVKDTLYDGLNYTLVTDVPHNREIELLRIGNQEKADNSFDPLNKRGTYEGKLNAYYSVDTPLNFSNESLLVTNTSKCFEMVVYDDIRFFGYITINAVANSSFKGEIRYNGKTVSWPTSTGHVGQPQKISTHIQLDGSSAEGSLDDIYKKPGEPTKIEVFFSVYNAGQNGLEISYKTETFIEQIRYTDNSTKKVPFGGIIPISKNLGFDLASDLFKFYIQLYGLTVFVDEKKRIVYAFSMDKINDNKKYARDWSEKLNDNNLVQSFTVSNYAQKNFIKLKENTNQYQESGSFSISNTTLGEEKTLFELPVNSVSSVKRNVRIEQDIANISDIEISDSDGKKTYKYKTDKPVCVTCDEADEVGVSVWFDSDKKRPSQQASLPCIRKLNVQNTMNEYYKMLSDKMLNKAKILEADFFLNEDDIAFYTQVFNDGNYLMPGCFIPIYLKQTGKYYYINKISNFKGNKGLTKVELVKI